LMVDALRRAGRVANGSRARLMPAPGIYAAR
jgi:hypothetical protein